MADFGPKQINIGRPVDTVGNTREMFEGLRTQLSAQNTERQQILNAILKDNEAKKADQYRKEDLKIAAKKWDYSVEKDNEAERQRLAKEAKAQATGDLISSMYNMNKAERVKLLKDAVNYGGIDREQLFKTAYAIDTDEYKKSQDKEDLAIRRATLNRSSSDNKDSIAGLRLLLDEQKYKLDAAKQGQKDKRDDQEFMSKVNSKFYKNIDKFSNNAEARAAYLKATPETKMMMADTAESMEPSSFLGMRFTDLPMPYDE